MATLESFHFVALLSQYQLFLALSHAFRTTPLRATAHFCLGSLIIATALLGICTRNTFGIFFAVVKTT